MLKLVLVRGLPGSGKSTFARSLASLSAVDAHYETDQFFVRNGKYEFDPTKLQEAHDWCQRATREALRWGRSVAVANTFTMLWEIRPYEKIAEETDAHLVVFAMQGRFESVHGVPESALERMRERWERHPIDLPFWPFVWKG